MNETNLIKISDTTQAIIEDNNENIEQPLKKSFKEILSLLGDGDTENEDINNRENIKPLDKENEMDNLLSCPDEKVENRVDANQKLKPMSRKDKIKLASDTQRIIRENEDVQFSYKPKQCKRFSELKEMLEEIAARKDNRHVTVINNETIKSIDESKEMNKENNDTLTDMTETKSSDGENDIAPLRNRIVMNNDTRKLLDKSASKSQVRKSLDTIMKEKYKNTNCLIHLKSREQYKEEKKMSEALLKKLKENLKPMNKTIHEIDLVVKERGGIHHHIHISDTSKCVKLAGEIDPLLSKGIKLSEEEERKWMGMSKKDKWKKHRSLLLAAEAEKRRAAREERIKEMNLRDEEKKKEVKIGEVKDNNGISDDDYEWKEEDASDSDSQSDSCDDDSVTDRGELSNNGESDDDLGQRIDKHRFKKRIIGSDDEEQIENTSYDNEVLLTSDQKSPIVVDEELNFFDIPTSNSNCDDLFSDSALFNITINSTQSKSQNSSCVTLSSEQRENTIPDSEMSFYSSFSINKSFNDIQPLHKYLSDTDIIERSADTVMLDKNLDDTQIIKKNLHDTVILDKNLDDTLIMEKNLDDTQIMEKNLDDTVMLDKSDDRIEVTQNVSTVNKELVCQETEYFAGSIEMRSEHRKLFDFTLCTEANSVNPTQPSVKQSFNKLKELLKEDSENDIDGIPRTDNIGEDINEDIDDVHFTDDDDEEEDDDDSVDLDRITPRKIGVLKPELLEDDKEEGESITDASPAYDSTDGSDSEHENNDNGDYEESLDADEDEEEVLRKQIVGITSKTTKEFFDDEAELSGSDAEQFGPDEDGSDLDRYEEEEGNGEKLPSEGRLRRQIERIHNRIEIDNDARDIRYLKELYLEDGDLHIGGEGPRKKRFTWAGINDNPEEYSQFGGDAAEEDDDNADDFQTMDLDQSLDKADGKEEDETITPLIEKYGKHLENCKWVPKNVDPHSEIRQAWQTTDNAKGTINKSDQIAMISSSSVIRKYGSFMSRANVVPPPAALNPSSSTMSLKSRMQQHTFTIESKSTHQKNVIKRQSNAGNPGGTEDPRMSANKKHRMN